MRKLAGLLILAALVAVGIFVVRPLIEQDKCLDSGGAWHAGHCVR